MTTAMSLAQRKAKPLKMPKGKKPTGRPPTGADPPAQAKPEKERGALDLVRIMAIKNREITTAEAKAQLEATGKVISDSSLASVLYEIRKTMTLLAELGLLKD